MLDTVQRDFLLKKLNAIYSTYYPLIPFSQSTWDDFIKDTHDLNNLCKHNEDVKAILLEFIRFFDVLHTKIK